FGGAAGALPTPIKTNRSKASSFAVRESARTRKRDIIASPCFRKTNDRITPLAQLPATKPGLRDGFLGLGWLRLDRSRHGEKDAQHVAAHGRKEVLLGALVEMRPDEDLDAGRRQPRHVAIEADPQGTQALVEAQDRHAAQRAASESLEAPRRHVP